MKYVIESGIPIERWSRGPRSEEFKAFTQMEVGDSFCIILEDESSRPNLYQRLSSARQAMRRTAPNFDYITRKVEEDGNQ